MMIRMNRRAMIALAAAMAATPVVGQEATAAAPVVKDFSIGAPDAAVKMVEYASFTCPHCAHFHETVFKDLKRDYIDTGKVHFTLREVYFDRYGLWSAMMARCGGDLKYFGIADILFSTQAEW
jgi:protein-disulfide isomerase